MDDMSVFRRFFVMSNLLAELISMITGRELSDRGENTLGANPGPNPFASNEAPINGNQAVGGQSPPIQGTRPATPRRRRRGAPQLPNTVRYGFPKTDESV